MRSLRLPWVRKRPPLARWVREALDDCGDAHVAGDGEAARSEVVAVLDKAIAAHRVDMHASEDVPCPCAPRHSPIPARTCRSFALWDRGHLAESWRGRTRNTRSGADCTTGAHRIRCTLGVRQADCNLCLSASTRCRSTYSARLTVSVMIAGVQALPGSRS